MSAKELGQIHNVNVKVPLPNQPISSDTGIRDIDCSLELTKQLERMVRQGNSFKVVGIDMSLSVDGANTHGHSVSGYLRYYTPTRGRCAAYRAAFKSMADNMKIQGITMRDNPMYDFRVGFNYESYYAGQTVPNQATLDGVNGLLLHHTGSSYAVFDVHNKGVKPTYEGSASDLFSEGFPIGTRAVNTDFVLNDTVVYTGNELSANISYETIPFQITFSGQGGDEQATATFQWRPDPALYLSVMCGLFQVVIVDSSSNDPGLITADLNVSVMISGWKSIMGNPDKKKRRTARRRKK